MPTSGGFLAAQMQHKGVRMRFRSSIVRIARADDGKALRATLADGSVQETDCVMYATGRAPNTRGLGLENAGVTLAANGAVVVDAKFQSSVPSIYAVGDVIDRVLLTPVALAEGMVVAENLFGTGGRSLDYEGIPTAIFSNPNVGTVGLSEAKARERVGEIDVYRTTFVPLRHQLTGSGEQVLMKLVVDKRPTACSACIWWAPTPARSSRASPWRSNAAPPNASSTPPSASTRP